MRGEEKRKKRKGRNELILKSIRPAEIDSPGENRFEISRLKQRERERREGRKGSCEHPGSRGRQIIREVK